MKTIEELLKNLTRPEVQEFGLVTNRLPSVNIGGKFEPVDDEAPGNERLMQMLVTMGGGRHVDSLGEKAVQWSTRVEGLGVIAVAAILRKDIIQARFTVIKRDGASGRPPSERGVPAARPESLLPLGRPSALPAPPAAPAGAAPATKPEKGAASPQPPNVKPASTPKIGSASIKPPVPARAAPSVPPPPPSEDIPWLDRGEDNEPTLQTQGIHATNLAASVAKRELQKKARSPSAEEVATPRVAVEPRMPVEAAAISPQPQAEKTQPSPPQPERASDKMAARPAQGRRMMTPTSVDAVEVAKPVSPANPRAATDLDLAKPAAAAIAAVSPANVAQGDATKSRVAVTMPSIGESDRARAEAPASLEALLATAVTARASDVFVVADRPLLLRIAGSLVTRTPSVAAAQIERMVKDVVPARARDALERDGSCSFAIDHAIHGRLRANVSRQRTGLTLTLRLVPKELPKLGPLGLSDATLEAFQRACGLVLVTGPVGHGKSTTLAALVDHLNRETARHVMTIEDPIEYVHPRRKSLVSQREVGLHGSRARLFETALRSDADVLVFGDIVDAMAARQVLLAADGGRLVLATISAPTTPRAIERVLDLSADGEEVWARATLAASLRLVVGQRLLPAADRARIHAAVELLPASTELSTLVREGRTREISELQRRGRAVGMVRLDESLADLVRSQKVPVDVAKQFAESPADLEAQIAARIAAMPAVSVKRA